MHLKITQAEASNTFPSFQRVYYDTVTLTANELRGAAPVEQLQARFGRAKPILEFRFHHNTDGTFLDVQVHATPFMINNVSVPSGATLTLHPGCTYRVRIDFLDLKIEVSDDPPRMS